MTLGTTSSSITVQGNGINVTFAYPFLMPAASDAVVTYTAVGGAQTVLLPTQFNISGIGSPTGGTVVYPLSGAPIPGGSALTIARQLPVIQPTSISNQGPTFGSIETEFDYLTMLIQQVGGDAQRAITVNPADPVGPYPLPIASVRAGQFLLFDSNGNPTVGSAVSGNVPVSAAMQPVVEASTVVTALALMGGAVTFGVISALRAYTGTLTSLVNVGGYYAVGDGGGGLFTFELNDITSADNGGTIIVDGLGRRWYRMTFGLPVSIRAFGATIDGITDDAAAWNNILAAAEVQKFKIYHPGGTSVFTGNMALKNQSIMGVDSYHAPPDGPITCTSMVEFHGNFAGITLQDQNSGGYMLEKIGFSGIASSYSGQQGFILSDALRPTVNEGWPTFRDVLFVGFTNGGIVGNKYQSGWMWNVYFLDCTQIGYQNESTDWYHHGVSCGSSTVTASRAQLILGASGGALTYSSGNHQFIGGAFFNGTNTVVITNSYLNSFTNCYIQNGVQNGAIIGNGSTGANGHNFTGCTFSGNNSQGGARNVSNLFGYDIAILGAAREIIITDCHFATVGAGGSNGPCVAASIFLALNTDACIITDNHFNMDMIQTPGAPSAPQAIRLDTGVPAVLDHYTISGNMRSYGEQGVYPFQLLELNSSALINPYTANGTACLNAGVAMLEPPSGVIGLTLPNPGFAGRSMLIGFQNSGCTVTATTASSMGGHTTATAATDSAWLQLISTSATAWLVQGNGGVSFS